MFRYALAAVVLFSLKAEDLPRGRIIESVTTTADQEQSYALYVPSTYSNDRAWPLILAFDPRANGRAPVATYQAAGELYGYIVAGSNVSRNGPWAPSFEAAQAMLDDVKQRFHVDSRRIYGAGHSGGARLAMALAFDQHQFAGVLASSASFPFDDPPNMVPFPVFGTAGTEDFNYLEMRHFDAFVTSPHALRIFDGGHVWPPASVAVEAVEWMEIQAMKSGLRPKDEVLIDRIYAARRNDAENYRALSSLASDFEGLRDVKPLIARAAALKSSPAFKQNLLHEAEDEAAERNGVSEISRLGDLLGRPETRETALSNLRKTLDTWAKQSRASDDSPQRQLARRVIRTVLFSSGNISDPEFRNLLQSLR